MHSVRLEPTKLIMIDPRTTAVPTKPPGTPYNIYMCVFFTLNSSFCPSASSTTSVRADSSINSRRDTDASSVVTKLCHRDIPGILVN